MPAQVLGWHGDPFPRSPAVREDTESFLDRTGPGGSVIGMKSLGGTIVGKPIRSRPALFQVAGP